ncbi:hypothetical protein [Microcoleus sp. FACHB-672]|uniref:hypothetical protein n=1 Tax=Microcoleus sp. FACHB-672 TaxID=2692825 RepID=UPI0028165B36|nr:hypothetical protein [Microcoleus sp. FACHB-672]
MTSKLGAGKNVTVLPTYLTDYSGVIMQLKLLFQPITISEILSHSSSSGLITRKQRSTLMSALLEDWLTEEDRAAIDRLLYAVRRGWLKIVD